VVEATESKVIDRVSRHDFSGVGNRRMKHSLGDSAVPVCGRSRYEEIRVTYTAQTKVYKEDRKGGKCKVIEAQVPKWWGAESSNQAPGCFRRADPHDRKRLRASIVELVGELTSSAAPDMCIVGHGVA
jgi:hypothetical protein